MKVMITTHNYFTKDNKFNGLGLCNQVDEQPLRVVFQELV